MRNFPMLHFEKQLVRRFAAVFMAIITVFTAGFSIKSAKAYADTVYASDLPEYISETRILVSPTHSAALYGTSLYMWGSNRNRQIPGTSVLSTAKPMLLLGDKTTYVRDIAVTENRTLLISQNNILYGFGVEPVAGNRYPASGSEIAHDVIQVSAIDGFAVFLKRDGSVWTMGKNDKGQLGYGRLDDLIYPVKLNLTNIKKVAAGKDFALALAEDGTLYGWGNNESWQLGLNSPIFGPPENEFGDAEVIGYVRDSDTFTPKIITTNVKDMAAGESHMMVLKNDDTLWTAGDNSLGQIGREPSTYEFDETTGSPVQSQSFDSLDVLMRDVETIECGLNHSYVRTRKGRQLVWGSNMQGQLGFQETDIAATPVEIQQNFTAVKQTGNSSFGYDKDEIIYSYGESRNNVTAKNNGRSSSVPVAISTYYFQWQFMATGEENNYWNLHPTAPMNGISRTFIGGYGDNTFRPPNSITRVEFLKMAVEALTVYDSKIFYEAATFTDINEDAWYANVLSFAQQYGFVGGYSDNTFRPHNTISRAEAAHIIANIVHNPVGTHNFPDVAAGSWAEASIASLCTMGVLGGYPDGSFKPSNEITRAEAAKVVATSSGFSPSLSEQAELRANSTLTFTDIRSNTWYIPYVMRGVGDVI